jgi:hypothetical protein
VAAAILGLNSICLASGSSRRAANAGHKQKTINKYTHPPARFPQPSANEPAFEPKSQNPVDENRRFFPEPENWRELAISVNQVLRFWSKPFETATRLPKTWDILKSCIRPPRGKRLEPHPPQNNNTNATGNPHQEARIQAPENTPPAQRHSPTTANHPLANTPTQHPPTSEVLRTPQPHVRHAPPTATVHKVRPKCAHAKPPRGRKQLAMYIFGGGNVSPKNSTWLTKTWFCRRRFIFIYIY